MSYLTPNDYRKQIQDQALAQVTRSNPSILTEAETHAQKFINSKISQKYDVSVEFTDTNAYDPTLSYKAASRVYLNAPIYQSQSPYAVGSLAMVNGSVYICTTATFGEPFNASHWTLLGTQYQIFYAVYPFPLFTFNTGYNIGVQVFWKGNIYTALKPTHQLDQVALLQYRNYNNVPLQNVAPDNPWDGATYWQNNGSYSVPANSLLNATYFTPGDNRNALVVTCMIDIVLYEVHSAIAPMNIPELRRDRYREAKDWLEKVKKGEDTVELVAIQPPQGGRIRWGSNVKNINGY